jgi:hypothetical protein
MHRVIDLCRITTMVLDVVVLFVVIKRFRGNPRKLVTLVAICALVFHFLPEKYIYPELKHLGHKREAKLQMDGNPALVALLEARPDLKLSTFDALVRAIDARESSPDGTYRNPLAEVFGRVFPDYAVSGSDEAIVRFARALGAVLKQLNDGDPLLCFQWLRPRGSVPSITSLVGKERVSELEIAMSRVVETGLRNPQRPPDAERAQATIQRIMGTVAARLGRENADFAGIGTTPEEQGRFCRTTIAIYDEYLTLPESDASEALRYLWSKNRATVANQSGKPGV